MKPFVTNDKALRNRLKAVEELGILAPAILRERLLKLCELQLQWIDENPEQYNNPVFHSEQFKNVIKTFAKELEFDNEEAEQYAADNNLKLK